MLDFFSNYLKPCTGRCSPGECIGDLVYDFQSGSIEETEECVAKEIKKAFKYAKKKDLPCLKGKSFADFKSEYRMSLREETESDIQKS